MEARPLHPDDRAPLHELSEHLRPAVEQVRAEPVPQESLDRALDRAQKLGPLVIRPRPRYRWAVVAAAGVAAALLVGLWMRTHPGKGRSDNPGPVAVNTHPSNGDNNARRDGTSNTIDLDKPTNQDESDPGTRSGDRVTVGGVKMPSPPGEHPAADPSRLPDLKPSAETANKPGRPPVMFPPGGTSAGTGRPTAADDAGGDAKNLTGGSGGKGDGKGKDQGKGGESKGEEKSGRPSNSPATPIVDSAMPSPPVNGGNQKSIQEARKNREESRQMALETRRKADEYEREKKQKRPATGKNLDDQKDGTLARGRGEGENGKKAADAVLKDAESDLTLLKERAEWSDRMSRPGRRYVTPEQARSDRARAEKLKKEVEQLREAQATYTRVQNLATKASTDAKALEEAEKSVRQAQERVQAVREGRGHDGISGGKAEQRRIAAAEKEVEELQQRYQRVTRANRQTPNAVSEDDVRVIRKQYEFAYKRLKDLKNGGKQSNVQLAIKEPEKAPVVWHRDRSRPTFARVYVGDGNALELVSLQVTVTVEGPRARTVVDHIFRNPHDRQLEGTFEYPLPTGASPSYFAMFLGQTRDTVPVRFARRGEMPPLPAEALARMSPAEIVRQVNTADWGKLQEARIVSKEKALETYEEVVRGRIDPALLEYSGGNTFSGRVFPIPAKGYNRVVLAYEELLPFSGERMVYRFPLPHCKLTDMQFTLQASERDCRSASFSPKDAKKQEGGSRLVYSRNWSKTTPEGEVLFTCTPANSRVQALSGRQGENGPRYLYARLRPDLKKVAKNEPFADHAVFLLDTSLSEHPDRFDVSMRLLRRILETDPGIKRFNVLTFNVGAAWVEPRGWLPNTAAGRKKAFARLDGLVLEGATDLSSALDKLTEPGFPVASGTPLDCFLLSDAHITWGEPDVASLVARFEGRCPFVTRFHCYRTGLGEENAELFEALTRKGGGVFQCFGEADLEAAAQAHRSQCLRVEKVRFAGGPASSDLLVAGRRAAVYPGGELVVAARFNDVGRTTVLVEGTFAGKKFAEEYPLEIGDGNELAPRCWAEVAVASLLALNDSRLDPLVTAYCQQFGIVSRAASFLVLENENDYKRFNLEEERGKTFNGDLGKFLTDTWSQMGRAVTARDSFNRFLKQVDKRVPLLNGPEGPHVARLLALLRDADFELPHASVRGALLHKEDVAPEYLAARGRDRRDVAAYLREARRRANGKDIDGAVRALSSVIEEYPTRGDALRLVGYRLLDLKQPALAARLFQRVQRDRPFEPHSYRDLARSLEESGLYGLAAVQYEIVLAGNWHARFAPSLKVVAREEYARMMQDAIRHKAVRGPLADHFGERLEKMADPQPRSDLRVTISWNTDATDIDLWVIEPDGTKCFYAQSRTPSGGELSQDQTQGYGPERYQIGKAGRGTYTILVHYFRPNQNLLGGETHVNVMVTRNAGSAKEVTERHTVILKKHDEQAEVCKVKF